MLSFGDCRDVSSTALIESASGGLSAWPRVGPPTRGGARGGWTRQPCLACHGDVPRRGNRRDEQSEQQIHLFRLLLRCIPNRHYYLIFKGCPRSRSAAIMPACMPRLAPAPHPEPGAQQSLVRAASKRPYRLLAAFYLQRCPRILICRLSRRGPCRHEALDPIGSQI